MNKSESSVKFSVKWTLVTLVAIVAAAIYVPAALFLIGFLGVVITTHEAGHYYAAKAAGMKPTEFFWGFGPEIVAFEKNGCRYGLKVLSLGGYVKLEGMTKGAEIPEGFEEAGTFRAASPLGRLGAILAGPAVNLVTAVGAFTVAELINGASFSESVKVGFSNTWLVFDVTIDALATLVSNFGAYVGSVFGASTAPVDFMSIITQAQESQNAVEAGATGSLIWFGILATAIGVLNLMPLPPLDGGHALAAITDLIARSFFKMRDYSFDMKRVVPVAYMTLGVLVFVSLAELAEDGIKIAQESGLLS